VLYLSATAAVEHICVAILRQAQGIPIADRGLYPKFGLEGAAREPHLGSSSAHRAVLEQHPHDGHHCKTAIGQLSI